MTTVLDARQEGSYEFSYPSYSVLLVLRAGENGRTPCSNSYPRSTVLFVLRTLSAWCWIKWPYPVLRFVLLKYRTPRAPYSPCSVLEIISRTPYQNPYHRRIQHYRRNRKQGFDPPNKFIFHGFWRKSKTWAAFRKCYVKLINGITSNFSNFS